MATNEQLLADAQTAYHQLMTGQQVASFRDSDGTNVTYTPAKIGDLADYIVSLGGDDPRRGTKNVCGPLRPVF